MAGQLAEESRQVEAARRRLASGRTTLLSELGLLDGHAFGLFLDLLGEALSEQSGPETAVERRTGDGLLQIRDALSPGYCLNPAVVPAHDPALLVSAPGHVGWFLEEGCSHLSVEAFWQMSKVIEVRYDRFLALDDSRARPLEGL